MRGRCWTPARYGAATERLSAANFAQLKVTASDGGICRRVRLLCGYRRRHRRGRGQPARTELAGAVYILRDDRRAPRRRGRQADGQQMALRTTVSAGPWRSTADTVVVGAYADNINGGDGGPVNGLRLPHERRRRHVRRGGQVDGLRRRCVRPVWQSVAIDGATIVIGTGKDGGDLRLPHDRRLGTRTQRSS